MFTPKLFDSISIYTESVFSYQRRGSFELPRRYFTYNHGRTNYF